jgi:putative transposase
MVKESLAAQGIVISHETVRQWAIKFGQQFANFLHLPPTPAPLIIA